MVLIDYSLAMGALFVVQGVYTLSTGDLRLLGFVLQRSGRTPVTGYYNRITTGIFYFACGVFALAVPFLASLGTVPLWSWMVLHSAGLLVVALCVVPGIFLLARPTTFVKWLRSYHPEIPADKRWVALIPTSVGLMLVGIGIHFLAQMLYYTLYAGPR